MQFFCLKKLHNFSNPKCVYLHVTEEIEMLLLQLTSILYREKCTKMGNREHAIVLILIILLENFWRRIHRILSINHFYPEQQFMKCNKH